MNAKQLVASAALLTALANAVPAAAQPGRHEKTTAVQESKMTERAVTPPKPGDPPSIETLGGGSETEGMVRYYWNGHRWVRVWRSTRRY